jgi:TetR/AcrR family transcriptional repressor of nem operon
MFLMKSTTTKEAIIRNGAALIHSKGYHNTGLTEILNAAGVPKGSFYFYFKSKDEFGLAVLDYYWDFIQGMAEAHCSGGGTPPLERLERFIDAYNDLFESMGFCRGCPIGNLMQEMSDLNEDFRSKVSTIYSRMKDFIAHLLEEAGERGDLPPSIDTSGTAQFILNSWEGAIMHMKLTKDGEPLRLFKQMVFERILK